MAMQNPGKPQQSSAKPGTPTPQRPQQTPPSKPGQQRPGMQPDKKK